MRDDEIKMPPILDAPLSVDIVEDEIVIDGFASLAPTLTVEAARETAQRLMIAVTFLEAQRRYRPS